MKIDVKFYTPEWKTYGSPSEIMPYSALHRVRAHSTGSEKQRCVNSN